MKLKQKVVIIGEGKTEKWYFHHLRSLKGYSFALKPRFFDQNTCICNMEKKVDELLSADVKTICVFDADVTRNNKTEKERVEKFIEKYKDNENVLICDSLPSIEFWFFIHFEKRNRHYSNCAELVRELVKYIKKYDKTEKFLINEKWVQDMTKDNKLEEAVKYAKALDPKLGSYSNIYKSINFFEEQIEN